ncbi:MAG: serine hydrolase [Candidatus Anaerobiospirillum pullicola]|uniref:serine-type D-Ala-D-Ala carboxypeptidase n=1 Tax=Candidatus Anaerobiospirillum pullicola TaxID=2838451 RepID=A0A948TH26_9GAMM|nr:serine hydrolase [Candidatus Anaerobiospirillum pullicola]
MVQAADESIPDPFAAIRAQQQQQGSNPTPATTNPSLSPAPVAPIIIPEAPTFNAESWVLMDYATGQVLFEHEQHRKIWPASLTKMMTSYVIGMEIKAGRLDPEGYVTIPENAWAKNEVFSDSSKMFIEVGKKVKVSDLNKGIVIQSGNDACVALAVVLAGSEEGFVSVMNTYAKQLGLKNTHFANVHGLFDEQNYSTAYDMALLSRALIRDLPDEYKLYSQKEFTFNGIKQYNRNRLLWDSSMNVDGIKTGHLSAVGYNLAASSQEGNMRLIAVVIGAKSESDRASFCKQMLTYGFRYFESYTPFEQGKTLLTREVRMGDVDTVNLSVATPVSLMIPRGSQQSIKISYALNQSTFVAPIKSGEQLGVITFKLNDKVLAQYPLVATNTINEGSFFSRMWDKIVMSFTN